MLHTNCGELALLFDTFCRIWRAGGQATLTTSTKDGQVQSNLELQLGLPAAARAGAPSPSQRLSSPSSSPGHPGATRRRQPCHRGPAAKEKSRARAALHQAAKAAAAFAIVGASPSHPLGASPNLPEEAPPSHPGGASPSNSESSPPAASAPVSGGDLPLVSTDQGEATPPLPASEGVSSPAPGDVSPLAPRGAPRPYPAPGDASRFLKASALYQCINPLSSGQLCEKIFCEPRDLRLHLTWTHGTTNCDKFGQTLFVDADNLYIL